MREMKKSGIYYLNNIPKDWKVYKFKAFSKCRMGETILAENTKTEGIPIYSATQEDKIFGYTTNAKFLLSKGDIVIPARGNSIGCATLVKNEKATCTQTTIGCYDIKNINNKYYYYSILGLKDEWFKYDGSAIPQITVEQVKNNKLAVPSIEEQEKIVNYLDNKIFEINNIIQKTKEIIEYYKNYKQSIITEAVTKGIIKNRKYKESNVEWNRNIPENWTEINPKALFIQRKEKAYAEDKQLTASQKNGILYQDEYMEKEGVRVVIVQKDFDILKHVEPNDFVISMRSFQGGLEYSEKRGCISSAYVMLIPNLKKVYPAFYKWFFKSIKYINALQSTSNLIRDGQAMRYSNFSQIRLFDIPIEEQKDISIYLEQKVKNIDSLINKYELLNIDLEQYKKSLIYEYVTGKKEVI